MNKIILITEILLLMFSINGFAQETTKSRQFIIDSATAIGEFSSVDLDVVGPGGFMTAQLNRFLFLLESANDQELVSLINSNKPNIRAYAFWALAIKKYNQIKAILEAQLSDSSVIYCRLNCANFPLKLNRFYLMILSTENHLMHGVTLSEGELSKYRNQTNERN